eukprot:CAMPEP_0202364384 /NCGR_PEP_ID=MMETSP1126-20121109/15814_1 /ASSEMBLY_ACC=CAM_ASM_000457 /TAXON_ID=3047 /ORGANISM="Dunaliella tertiolecta, Strain CCMP1320" /LENGTH=62 /DNA_ID=CAMNT_0048959017 /DNA_START=803 /DNA_END=991 /DNA_ORIENTATION=+
MKRAKGVASFKYCASVALVRFAMVGPLTNASTPVYVFDEASPVIRTAGSWAMLTAILSYRFT